MKYEIPIALYEKINPILQEPLNYSDIDELKKQLSNLQAIRYELAYKRTEWYSKLVRERQRMLLPKDKGITEIDRKTMLQSTTSMIEADYEFMLALEKIIEDSISLGQTFLQTM